MKEEIKKAKEIISNNLYITIASVGVDGMPNNSPVYFSNDEKCNFFWNSPIASKHSENIRKNPSIFCVVFDSSQKEGTGRGVYMEGKAFEINDGRELEDVMKPFYVKKNKEPKAKELYLGNSPRRFYKFVPKKIYINTYEKVNGVGLDSKLEIKL